MVFMVWVLGVGSVGCLFSWVLGVCLFFCFVYLFCFGLEGVLITQKYIVSKCSSLFKFFLFIVFRFWNSVLFVFVCLSVYPDL